MKYNIGLIYDYKGDYHITNNCYCDFSSILEISYIKDSLIKTGHNIIDIGNPNNFKSYILNNSPIDLVFNMAEGYKSRNREGLIPAVCEFFNIKYIGTDSFGMSLTLNKAHTKSFLKTLSISTPKYFLFIPAIHKQQLLKDYFHKYHLNFPIIMKPNHEGSSMGVTLIYDIKQAQIAIQNLIDTYNQEILCEEYIFGREMSVPVYENKNDISVLGIAEFEDNKNEHIGIFSTEKKRNGFHIQKEPGISHELKLKIEQQSIIIFKALNLNDYARIDWIIKNECPYFIEATPLPCFEPNNCFEWSLKDKNISFTQFLKSLIDLNMEN